MRQWTIDAFAQAPFRGNPACVVEPFDAWPADAWMQTLAAENNQAETAFLLRTESADRFGLRWFTPALEVPLCGHATLARPLIVSRQDGGSAMDFPASPVRQVETPAGLAEALGVEPNEVWAGPFLVAVLKDEAAVRAATPDLAALTTISSAATQGRGNVGVSALAGGQPYDVVSRFFAPGSGIPEDPATGSLHCMLSPIFAQKLGRTRLDFHQAYPGRGGDLDCELAGDRVILRGQAVTVMDSRLRL